MPISDALVVGEDWISEDYFTTDATKGSFQARVITRRKEGDDENSSTRSRFVASRGRLEATLVGWGAAHEGEATQDTVSDDEVAAVNAFDDELLEVLGYRTGQFTRSTDGPLEFYSPANLEQVAPLVVLRARPSSTIEEIVDKKRHSLIEPWERADDDPIRSVPTALSTLLTDVDGPRFALVLAGRWCLIAERERWPEGRWLAIDLQLVCERNDAKRGGEIDRALTCLEAASLAPDPSGDTWWTSTLDESVKHTVGVSKDLQEGVRDSIEIIANEVVRRRRENGRDPLPDVAAQPLAVQSLRYLYRILFLLYAEASPELEVLPVGASEYDAGYGLDRLRDLALVELHEERSKEGTHLHESLRTLFRLVDRGHTPSGDESLPEGLPFNALRADLFRDEATALIDEVGLGNDALLKVLRKLLLSKESGRKQRGFISYVELGINQLGAVYEGLMSYTGSFAHTDLYEVAPNGDRTKGSWVVPIAESGHLEAKDFVQDVDEDTGERRAVVHPRGSFVFRLSGRDRQRSASYYTPEVLTRFTVQQALEELLDQDGHTTTAEEILGLSVCEPAMGSGAFAIEATRQLAEEYLSRREKEVGRKVDPEKRPAEIQKVKAHIALHQVYGVDLNATAVELAEVSLWLDTMVQGLRAPWFGLRLRRGNSLVGARRQLYPAHRLKDRSWLTTPADGAPLADLAARLDSPDAESDSLATRVHHFLLPAAGWGSAVEVPKSVRDLADPETMKRLKDWRRTIRSKPTAAQTKRLQTLAERVETLWGIALRRLTIAEAESSRSIQLWERETPVSPHAVTREQIEASLADPNGAYRRLRRVMDAWCALWFWPLTQLDVPPTLEQWIGTCESILGKVSTAQAERRGTRTFAAAADWNELGAAEELDLGFAGAKDVPTLLETTPWLRVADRVAQEQGFFHWELDFATVFARGGFDLQVGNPPWVRPRTDVESLFADIDPWWAVANKPSEQAKAERRAANLVRATDRRAVLNGTAEVVVLAELLSDRSTYPVLSGQPDLYRAFMSQVWAHASPSGISSLIHMESHLTDEKATALREATYRHLRRHWQFANELVLFDIDHHNAYGVHVYSSERDPEFKHATSLYHPDTVSRSLNHDGSGPEPGFKDDNGNWDQRPHRSRVEHVDRSTLKLWQDVLGRESWASTSMVYTVNSAAKRTLAQLARAARASTLGLGFSRGWDESIDRKAGRFVSKWGEAQWRDAILQGPHLHVSTPLYKEPNSTMRHNLDWSATDFESLAADALPVTAYKPAGDRAVYDSQYTHWGDERAPARDSYRVAWRAMAANTGERTLISAVIPPGTTHVHTVSSVGGTSNRSLARLSGSLSSLLLDFSLRATPKSAVTMADLVRFPIPSADHPLNNCLEVRTLRLNCVTGAYADLWADCWDDGFANDTPLLDRFDERPIGLKWTADTPLRRAVDRRNAQVEIDALVALMLGVPVDDLCTIYRTQFAVLHGYDQREYTYDANGRLVPNSVLTVWRKKGDAITEEERTATHPGSGIDYVYELPFATRDREADFRTAYAEFERRLAAKEGRV